MVQFCWNNSDQINLMKSNIHIKNRVKVYKKEKNKIYFKKIDLKINKKNFSLIDLGCAAGSFIKYVNNSKKNENNFFVGVEKESSLIKLSKIKNIKNSKIIKKDFTKKNFKIKKRFDYVTCLGTINLFIDIENVFKNFFKLCKKNGRIFVYDIFNKDPINTRLYVNFEGEGKKWINQFNCHSEANIKKICKKINPKSKVFFHEMNFKNLTVKKKNFPNLTSYTQKIRNKVYFVSPYNQILTFKILEIINK